MEKRHDARRAPRFDSPALIMLLIGGAACVVFAIAGCGGKVADDGPEPDDSSQDGGSTGGSGSTTPAGGACALCDGQADCAFCLIHGATRTFICPAGESVPSLGCMDLGEQHTSNDGAVFTCSYCY